MLPPPNTAQTGQTVKETIADLLFPLPRGLIMNLGIGLGWGIHQTELSQFSGFGYKNVEKVTEIVTDFTWPMSDQVSLGVQFGAARGQTTAVIGTQFFINKVFYSYTHLTGSYLLLSESRMLIKVFGGVGYITGAYDLDKSSESDGTFSRVHRSGESWSAKTGLSAEYQLNPIWTIGLNVGYFWADITDLENAGEKSASDYPDLSLTGATIGFFTGFFL